MKALADRGVEACFANPGTTEMWLVGALDAEPRVRPVLGLHETVCAGAADGYARMARKPACTVRWDGRDGGRRGSSRGGGGAEASTSRPTAPARLPSPSRPPPRPGFWFWFSPLPKETLRLSSLAPPFASRRRRRRRRRRSQILHLGPGLANALANLHNARRANVPVLNIVGDMSTWHRGADALLEMDVEARSISHWFPYDRVRVVNADP